VLREGAPPPPRPAKEVREVYPERAPELRGPGRGRACSTKGHPCLREPQKCQRDFAIDWYDQPQNNLNVLVEGIVLQPTVLQEVYDSTTLVLAAARTAQSDSNDIVVDTNPSPPPCEPHNLLN
jgi:hypothetical protein